MKKLIVGVILFTVVTFATLLGRSPAIAAFSVTNQSIEVFRAGEAKTYMLGKDLFTFKKLVNEDTSSIISLIEITFAPQAKGSLLLKKHRVQAREDFYILSGTVECSISQATTGIQAKSGDVIRIAAGLPYGCENVGSKPAKVLLVSASPALPDLVQEVGTPIAENVAISSTDSPLDMQKVAKIARKHGIEFFN